MWKSEFRQNYYRTSFLPTVPPFTARISRVIVNGGTWQLKWECLKAGESNGKLPPRTCPGCSVPEPYWSHDWAPVPAKPGLQGWILMNECNHIPKNKCSRYTNTKEREAICVSFAWAAWPCWWKHYNFSKHPVTVYPTLPRHNLSDSNLKYCHCENFKSCTQNVLQAAALWVVIMCNMGHMQLLCSHWWWHILKWQYAHTRLCDVTFQTEVLVFMIHKPCIS